MTFKVVISDPLSEEGIQPLREAENIEIDIATECDEAQLIERLQDADALLVRSQTQVTRELIEKAPQLKVIGRAGVGVDNIDLDAATERGIIVVNAPDGNTNSAAEHTVAMLMSLARNIPQAFQSLQDGKWDRKTYIGVELKHKTLGIIGLGRIGAEVAHRAKGQRMNVIAYDPFLTAETAQKLGVEQGTVDEVLAKSDFITIHTPLLDSTRNMINADAFAKMKDGVRIINCARGGIIDEDALYDAIVEGKVAGAALDVLSVEPFVGHKLLDLPQVIATPHLGASTVEAQESVAIDVSMDVIKFATDGTVRNPVNMPSISKRLLDKIEPFFVLTEKLGAFASHLVEGAYQEVNVTYAGELAEVDVRPLTRNLMKGLLTLNLGNHVNDVNSRYLSNRIGIKIDELKTTATKGFTNLITVEVVTEKGSVKVAGTLLNGLGPRIVKVDDYPVDVVPEGHLLLINHKDQPGAIGRVGMHLAAENVNIATMQVGRSEQGGKAIMILTVDYEVKPEEVEGLEKLDNVFEVKAINF